MKLRVYPRHWLDVVLLPILHLLLEPLSRKRSHFWHWIAFHGTIPEHFMETVDPDLNARPHQNLWSFFWNLNFGWKKVAVFRPAFPGRPYRIGFRSSDGNSTKQEICSRVVDGECAVLVGPYLVRFFAIDRRDGKFIPLDLVRVTRKAELSDTIPLL